MKNEKDFLMELIRNPDRMGPEDLDFLDRSLETFPYCSSLHLLKARAYQLENQNQDSPLINLAAIYSPDRTILFNLLSRPIDPESHHSLHRIVQEHRAENPFSEHDHIVEIEPEAKTEIDPSLESLSTEPINDPIPEEIKEEHFGKGEIGSNDLNVQEEIAERIDEKALEKDPSDYRPFLEGIHPMGEEPIRHVVDYGGFDNYLNELGREEKHVEEEAPAFLNDPNSDSLRELPKEEINPQEIHSQEIPQETWVPPIEVSHSSMVLDNSNLEREEIESTEEGERKTVLEELEGEKNKDKEVEEYSLDNYRANVPIESSEKSPESMPGLLSSTGANSQGPPIPVRQTFLYWLKKTQKGYFLDQGKSSGGLRLDTSHPIRQVKELDVLEKGYQSNIFHLGAISTGTMNQTIEFDLSQKEDQLIEKFLREDPQHISPFRPDRTDYGVEHQVEKASRDSAELVSETLAQIYYQQNLLDKAIMAYEKLILKMPEKKAYFAAIIDKIKSQNS